MDQLKEGWKWLINATKWHYFVDNTSLCGRWATLSYGDLESSNDESPDNCKACYKKLKSRQEKGEDYDFF